MTNGTCQIQPCTSISPERLRRGLCVMHYARLRRYGSPLFSDGRPDGHHRRGGEQSSRATILGRAIDSIADSGCWVLSPSRLDPNGYGHVTWNGRTRLAHRLAHAAWLGPIPEGMEVDHLCMNRGCVNPAHLEAVTHAENIRRSYAARRLQEVA